LTVILADYAVFGRCLIVRILKATGLHRNFGMTLSSNCRSSQPNPLSDQVLFS
jgi:hypothetical protein